MNQEKIDRINELYHKSQAEGLTVEEQEEQAALRKEYIEAVRKNLRGTLNNISIKEPDGSITDCLLYTSIYGILLLRFGGFSNKELKEMPMGTRILGLARKLHIR